MHTHVGTAMAGCGFLNIYRADSNRWGVALRGGWGVAFWGMNWFKRVEVWVLLLASGGLAVWALKGGKGAGEEAFEAGWQTAASEGGSAGVARRLEVLGGSLERDYGNARLDLLVRVSNPGAHPLLMSPPKVRLLAGAQAEREVPPFFLPVERPPEVAAGGTSEAKLRYWLEAKDVEGPLVLEVDGVREPVKDATPFDLKALENGKARPVTGVAW